MEAPSIQVCKRITQNPTLRPFNRGVPYANATICVIPRLVRIMWRLFSVPIGIWEAIMHNLITLCAVWMMWRPNAVVWRGERVDVNTAECTQWCTRTLPTVHWFTVPKINQIGWKTPIHKKHPWCFTVVYITVLTDFHPNIYITEFVCLKAIFWYQILLGFSFFSLCKLS